MKLVFVASPLNTEHEGESILSTVCNHQRSMVYCLPKERKKNRKHGMARNHDNVSEWDDMSIEGFNALAL